VLKVARVTGALFYVGVGVLWRRPVLVPVRECGGEKRKEKRGDGDNLVVTKGVVRDVRWWLVLVQVIDPCCFSATNRVQPLYFGVEWFVKCVGEVGEEATVLWCNMYAMFISIADLLINVT